MPSQSIRTYLLYFLLSAFAAFAAYRLHIEGFEQVVGEGLEAIINGTGRAPDQYRILPYLILSLLRDSLSPVFGNDWKPAIHIFETLSLFAAVVLLNRISVTFRSTPAIGIVLLLIYPYLMFDGVRSIAAFIFLFSCILINFSKPNLSVLQKIAFYFVLIAFSFTRADIALLVGLICSIYMMQSIAEKLLTAAIPLGVQAFLNFIMFPEAEYYSNLVMISDNISLSYLANNPTTYLLAGLTVFYWAHVKSFIAYLARDEKIILLLIMGYVLTVCIIGRPNEFRLFLPIFPVVLLILDKRTGRDTGTITG